MSKVNQIKFVKEKAVLVGAITKNQNEITSIENIDELSFLSITAGAIPKKRFIQKLNKINPRTFIGPGKINEISEYINKNKVDLVIFDDELSPSQIRNIEFILKNVKILDRTNLILDIFASRARTSYATSQVQLAQYQYLLPRLTRMWTHLQKQKGGIGMKGPGETEIETDRRVIRQKISLLKNKLKIIDKQLVNQRKNRDGLIRVSLVGYTNVGKSSIMNALSKSNFLSEDKLFATLDTTVRKVVINRFPFLLSDTVGFIRKLPTELIESFKSTLDEAREADCIIHVIDISNKNFQKQIDSVNKILKDIGIIDKPIILVFNKIDMFTYEKKSPDDLLPLERKNLSLHDWKKTWMSKMNTQCIFISTFKKTNWEYFKSELYNFLKNIHKKKYQYKYKND